MRAAFPIASAVLALWSVPAAGQEPIGPALRAEIMDAARVPVTAALHRPVRFKVDQLRMRDGWVFLLAAMQGPDGRPVSFAGSALAAGERNGMTSRTYAALLRRTGSGWRVAAHAIGPTDVAWEPWPARYGAPPALFGP